MCFPLRPSRSCNPEQPSPGSLNPRPCCVLASVFSATYCLAQSPMWSASIRPTLKLSRAAFLEQLVAQQLRQAFLTARSTQPQPPIRRLVQGLYRAGFRAHLHKQIPQLVFLLSPSRRCPTENSTRHTSWSGVFAQHIPLELGEDSTPNTLALARSSRRIVSR